VAVGESLQRAAGVEARLKWPNDVLVGGRKIAGVLLESRLGVEALTVVGVGVNLGQRAFPAQLAGRATSVLLATGRMPERETVLAALLEAFDHWRARLARDGFAPVRARWCALSETLGRRVTVDGLTGTAVDLDEDGALVVEADGTRRRVLAGDVVGAAPEA
jgi:BirA family biotin operon repressor/biotin-[acetyl-CoA-carboxylase] ligase